MFHDTLFNKRYLFFCVFTPRITPVPPFGLWTFEPAFSPRFSSTLSPRSFFQTGQRFLPILSPRSLFFHWSAVSHPKTPEVTSPEVPPALDQSEARKSAIWAPFTTGVNFPSHHFRPFNLPLAPTIYLSLGLRGWC